MTTLSRPAPAQQPTFATVADGVRAQVVTRQLLPPHLDAAAHQGRGSSCPCRPLLAQLVFTSSNPVATRGAREACTQEEHEFQLLHLATWPDAPAALRGQAHHGTVELMLTICGYCGTIEVRDISFHALAGMRQGNMAPRRRSDVLGWYAGKRPGGRIYL